MTSDIGEEVRGLPRGRIVAILARFPDGKYEVGSGGLVRPGVVVTARHCVLRGIDRDVPTTIEVIGLDDPTRRYPAEILHRGDVEAVADEADILLLEVSGYPVAQEPIRFGRVDRELAVELHPCDLIGFPHWQIDPERATRNPVHVRGAIRPLEDVLSRPTRLILRDSSLESMQMPTPSGRSAAEGASAWAGISGALVFHRGFAIGVVVEHNPGQGRSSLRVRPWEAVVQSAGPAPALIAAELSLGQLSALPTKWESELVKDGLYVWRSEDVEGGLIELEDVREVEPLERGESVDASVLRAGRLPNLQRDFASLCSHFQSWLESAQRKRGGRRVRVFWIVGDDSPHRSKGLLACLARAGSSGAIVYDTHRNIGVAGQALRHALAMHFTVRVVIAADLDDRNDSSSWELLRNEIAQGKKWYPISDDHLYPTVVLGGTAQQMYAAAAILTDVEIVTYDVRGRVGPRAVGHEAAQREPLKSKKKRSLPPEHEFNRGLPITAKELVGREQELQFLRKAWESPDVRIVPIVAYGGTGKSALINSWLAEMRDKAYRGAERVLAWSFYSQGTKDNLVSADPFVSFALRWFGDDESITLNPVARGIRLAELIKEHKYLVVLDGLEPLQHPREAQDVRGRLTDDSMRALLQDLADPHWRGKGLCVITTRVPVTDLEEFEEAGGGGSVRPLPLDNLGPRDAGRLIQTLSGSTADMRDLVGAAQDVGCHALAVTLLGNYIKDAHGGDLNGRYDLEELLVEERDGGHARRIMASYVSWLEQGKRTGELAILKVIGLFDRPAPEDAMAQLLSGTDFDPLTGEFDAVGGRAWNKCVESLRGMGLLNREIPSMPDTLDAHPLVREHFRYHLQKRDGDSWSRGNRVLFDYYRGLPPAQPVDLEGMSALYAAVTHGCAAGLHEDVYENVLLTRVWHDRRTSYATRQLGMTGSDLVALSNFFKHRRWTDVQDTLSSPRARVLIRTNAGVRLRQLGRLPEARQCFSEVVSEIDRGATDPEELEDASYAASQNCELLVIGGDLEGALRSGQKAIEYADGGRDPYFRMHARSSLAEVFFMRGDFAAAADGFNSAMEIDERDKPRPPFLYSQSLFRYAYFLIETGRPDELLAGCDSPGWGTNEGDSSRLSRAIRSLALGAAHRALIEQSGRSASLDAKTEVLLDDAVVLFRGAGYADYLVRGLIERSTFLRVRGRAGADAQLDYSRGMADLTKAISEAVRGQMDILHADSLLGQIALRLAFLTHAPRGQRKELRRLVAEELPTAHRMVRDLRYGRRYEALDATIARAVQLGVDVDLSEE